MAEKCEGFFENIVEFKDLDIRSFCTIITFYNHYLYDAISHWFY